MQRDRKYNDEKLNRAQSELWEYRKLKNEIGQLQQKANEYKERYNFGVQAQRYDSIKVMGGEWRDRMVETVIEWAELEHEAEPKRLEAERKLWRIDEKLKKLSHLEHSVLELYYIKNKSILQIERIVQYSKRCVITIKRTALEKYSKVCT